jgi:hypothetical protein
MKPIIVVLLIALWFAFLIFMIAGGHRLDETLRAKSVSVCMPYAVLGTYDRLGKTMVVCAQPDGGLVDRELP